MLLVFINGSFSFFKQFLCNGEILYLLFRSFTLYVFVLISAVLKNPPAAEIFNFKILLTAKNIALEIKKSKTKKDFYFSLHNPKKYIGNIRNNQLFKLAYLHIILHHIKITMKIHDITCANAQALKGNFL